MRERQRGAEKRDEREGKGEKFGKREAQYQYQIARGRKEVQRNNRHSESARVE